MLNPVMKHLQFLVQGGVYLAPGVVNKNSSRGMDVWGHFAVCPFSYIGPTVYAAGGDAQAANVFKLGVVEYVEIGVGVSANGLQAVIYVYNNATNKMQAFWQTPTAGANAPLAEVDNGTDLSGFTAFGLAFGKG